MSNNDNNCSESNQNIITESQNEINNNNETRSVQYSTSSVYTRVVNRIRPKFFKLLNQVITSHFDPILNYLDLLDLCSIRATSHFFLSIVHEYYQKRLKFEINLITSYQEENKEKTAIFMKNIDSQIPISNKNWLDFDLASVTSKLQLLDRSILTKLRSIKSIGKLSDNIYAPFCIIFGYNKNANQFTKNDTWKKTAGKILSDSNLVLKIINLDLENMSDSAMLSAFVFLNLPELEIDAIKKYSSDFAKLIVWCQAVVSYHILIHPYTYRNEKSMISFGSDVIEFANKMNSMINRFYKFKRFLFNLNIVKIPLADYVFNLQHNREATQKQESITKDLSEVDVGKILSYLPYVHSFKFMSISKKFYNGFKCAIDFDLFEIIKEIYFVKAQAYGKIIKKIPVMFSHNIFSNFFLMLDDILNSQCSELGMTFIPFLSKEQLNDLKKIKLNTELVNVIAKVFCLICDQKPERKQNSKGEINLMYIDKLRLLVINGKILKLLRNVNKLNLPQQKLQTINKELSRYCSMAALEEVKKVNHGIYQLLVWELFVLEFAKNYNPFDFINFDYITNRYDQEEIDLLRYYIEIMNYLKYHLKIKYHFSSSGTNINPSYGLPKITSELKKYLISQGMESNSDLILETTNPDYAKIASVYFEGKDLIPIGAKPALYERILLEILACREKDVNDENNDNMNNMIINESLTEGNYFDGGSNNINNEGNEINDSRQLSSIKEENRNSQAKERILMTNHKSTSSKLKSNKSMSKQRQKIFLSPSIPTNDPLFIPSNQEEIPCLSSLPNDIIIKSMLFYLDINSLPKFALINKKANQCIKTHIFIRLFFLNKEKKLIEIENNSIISSIELKRNSFFEEYEMEPPKKDHAYSLMNKITSDDVMEIKQCFRKFNKTYEIVISPLLILFGEKAKTSIKPDGTKVVSYYETAKKVLFRPGFIKRIRDMELETIQNERFHLVVKTMENPVFSPEKMKSLSPCLAHLVSWVNGVVEFHRVIRKYSLSSYDFEILDENEINFCREMDKIILLYYKLLRYATKYCKNYEKDAQDIMNEMNIASEN